MTAKRLIIIISVYLLSVTSDVIAGYCWKIDAWRAQVRRLSRLSEDTEVDAVVVARFKKNNHDIYTYVYYYYLSSNLDKSSYFHDL